MHRRDHSADDESPLALPMMRRWWRRFPLQGKVFGFTHNRYVISDYTQSEKFHSPNEASPLRLVLVHSLIHGLITTLLVLSAVGLWRLG